MLNVRRFLCRCIALTGLVSVAHPTLTVACSICVAFPQKTAADYLIDGRCVVFAREDPDKPFSYAPVEVLKGPADGNRIDMFLDSRTRRILTAHPERFVVLAQVREDRSWRNLGLADANYAAVVRRIVLLAPQWQGPDGNKRRVEFFVQLFGHENPVIYGLAYLEMARAPYGAIKRLSRIVPREQIERILARRQYMKWRPLAILMLAHRGEANDRQYIAESFHTAERLGLTTNLAAWAAASIELEGADAVTFIESQYFTKPNRTTQELTEVVKALSLHGTEGHTQLRDQIVASYGALLNVHPDLAPFVATDLLAWKRSELTQQLSTIEATHGSLDYAAKKTIREYLQLTATSNKRAQSMD